MKNIYKLFILFLISSTSFSQNFNWTSDFEDLDQLDTCNASLALNNNDGDLGNQDKTLTICSTDPDEVITLNFVSFSLNTTFSTLEIYDGQDTNGTLLFEYVSDAVPPNALYSSSTDGGCITLRFTTNFIPSIINIGFGAQLFCGNPCQEIFPEVEIDGSTTCEISEDIPFYKSNELLTFSGSALTSENTPAEDLTFEWDIDGNSFTGESVQIGFSNLGIKDATLSVTDNQGCTESIDFQFEIRNDTINISEMDDDFTLDELISDVFIAGDCAIVNNINSPNNMNLDEPDNHSIGYFSKDCSNFPFENGIVIGSGNVNNVLTGIASSGSGTWLGEDELATLATGDPNQGTSRNATVIEFEFSSYESEISFNYIFASYEYPNFVCQFADTFAFILSGPGIDDTNLYNNDANPNTPGVNLDLGGLNIASIEGAGSGLIPTTPTNIHPNTNCPNGSLGEFAMFQLYGQTDPPYHSVNGETQVLTASASVIPCEVYTMKLMVADFNDAAFDSFVFLEGGSFNIGANLGDDIFFTDAEPLFEGDVFTVEAFEDGVEGICDFTIEWYKDGELLEDETELTLDITETGNYEIFIISDEDSNLANCNSSDSIYVEFIPVPNPDNINDLQDLLICQPPLDVFDINLRTNDSFVLGTQNPDNFNVDYFLNEADANAGTNPIDNPENFTIDINNLQDSNLVIWIRVEEALTGNAQSFVTSSFEIGISEPDLNINIPSIQSCTDEDATFGVFDLTETETTIFQVNNSSDYSLSYFSNETDAINNNNPIENITAYQSNAATETLWVRLSSNFDTSCFEVTAFEVEVYVQPEINQLEDISVCGNFDTAESFDLSSITPASVNTPNPNITTLAFYNNEADAIAEINPITNNLDTYQLPDGIDTQDVFVRLTNNDENGNCFTISSFTLRVNNVEFANQLDDLIFCPDDTFAIPTFNLTTQNEFILGENQVDADYVINYFTNQNDADNNTNSISDPSSYTLSAGELIESVVVRISNANDLNCYETESFDVGEYEAPAINTVQNLAQCGDFSNSQSFDLTANNVNSVNTSNPDIVELSYYTSITDAEDATNPIIDNLTSYQLADGVYQQTIFIRLENNAENGSCFQIGQFSLNINNVEIAEDLGNFVQCEEEVAQNPTFDLTQHFDAILGNNQNASDYAISFHLNESGANNNEFMLQNPTNFQPFIANQEIWVRIENLNNVDCFAISSFQVISQELADVNLALEDILVCDNTNNDGFFNDFDFDALIPQINTQNLAEVEVSFHESLIDAEDGTNAISSPYTNSQAFSQTIYVRVENGTDLGVCEQFTSFDIFVNALPNITLPSEPLLDCDEDATGTATFNLTNFEAILFENTNPDNFTIGYYETAADANNQTNPILNPEDYFVDAPFTNIFIALDNGECPITVNAGLSIDSNDASCQGIGVENFSQQIQLYPNPVSSILNIDYSSVTPIQSIQVFNINGQRVFQQSYNGQQKSLQLNFSEYAAGIYLIEISNGKQKDMQKVIKK